MNLHASSSQFMIPEMAATNQDISLSHIYYNLNGNIDVTNESALPSKQH